MSKDSETVKSAVDTFHEFCRSMRQWELRCIAKLNPIMYGDASDEEQEAAHAKALDWLRPVYKKFCPDREPESRGEYFSEPPDYPEDSDIKVTKRLEKGGDEVWVYADFVKLGLRKERVFVMKRSGNQWYVTRTTVKVGRKYEEVSP